MPITLKKDEWKVKDPSSGNYRGAAILSTTLPEDAAQIIEDTQNALDAEEVRAGQIINDTQNTVNGIEAQSSLILENITKAIHNGTDSSLTVQGMPADAKATGDLKMSLPTANDYGENGQYPRSTGNGIEWTDYGLPSDEQTAEAISTWLDAHPEATTTVQDHSLTYEKLINGTLNYVTPEMFGAYGNGEHNDTNAFIAALEYNMPLLLQNTYLLQQITLNNDIIIGTKNNNIIPFTSSQDTFVISNSCHLEGINISGGKIPFIIQGNNNIITNCNISDNIAKYSITIADGNNNLISNINFSNCGGISIYGYIASKNNIIRNCKLENILSSTYAIYFMSSLETIEIENCIIEDCYLNNCAGGGIFTGGKNNRVTNCYIGTTKLDSSLTTTTGQCIWIHDCSNIIIDHCICNGSKRGIEITNSKNTTISNCIINDIDYHGIKLTFNQSSTAIYTGREGNSGVNINNCFINGHLPSNGYDAIQISGYSNVNISNVQTTNKSYRALVATVENDEATTYGGFNSFCLINAYANTTNYAGIVLNKPTDCYYYNFINNNNELRCNTLQIHETTFTTQQITIPAKTAVSFSITNIPSNKLVNAKITSTITSTNKYYLLVSVVANTNILCFNTTDSPITETITFTLYYY